MKTLKEKIEVMQAALDGKTIQFRDLYFNGKLNDAAWSFGGDEYTVQDMAWDWDEYDYRVKPQPPAKKTVAMQPEDYPPVFWVRRIGLNPEKMVLCICIHGAWITLSSYLSGYAKNEATIYELAAIDVKDPRPCEYSVDRKVWLPCVKEVDA